MATFGNLTEFPLYDTQEVGRTLQLSKGFILRSTQGQTRSISKLDLTVIALFVSVGTDIGYVRTILADAAAVPGIEGSTEPV